jgi:hypothetical protein
MAEPGKGKGRGPQKPESTTEHIEKTGKRVVNEAVDAVADELLDDKGRVTTTGSKPPGLAKKDKIPPGLEKQGKVPAGWSQGKKTGWDKTGEPKKESLVRRIIRGIFRKKQEPAPTPPAAQ